MATVGKRPPVSQLVDQLGPLEDVAGVNMHSDRSGRVDKCDCVSGLLFSEVGKDLLHKVCHSLKWPLFVLRSKAEKTKTRPLLATDTFTKSIVKLPSRKVRLALHTENNHHRPAVAI